MPGAFEFLRVKSLSAKTTGASSTDSVIEICALHNLRQSHPRSRDKETGSIDPLRSHMNVILRGCDTAADVVQTARELVRINGWQKQYQRSNAAVAAEMVISLPGNMQTNAVAYFDAGVAWAETYFDAPALTAAVHLDQAQPHCHLVFLAARAGQWRGGRFFGDRNAINDMHAAFHAAVGRPHGLRRRQQSRESSALRHATAARELDAVIARQGLMDDPAVRQALISLIAFDPDRLRAAREQVTSTKSALPDELASEGEKMNRYPVIALSPDNAPVINAMVDHQDADITRFLIASSSVKMPFPSMRGMSPQASTSPL